MLGGGSVQGQRPVSADPEITRRLRTAASASSNTCIPASSNTCIPAYANACIPASANTCIPASANTCIPASANACIHASANACIPASSNTCASTPANTCIHASSNTHTSAGACVPAAVNIGGTGFNAANTVTRRTKVRLTTNSAPPVAAGPAYNVTLHALPVPVRSAAVPSGPAAVLPAPAEGNYLLGNRPSGILHQRNCRNTELLYRHTVQPPHLLCSNQIHNMFQLLSASNDEHHQAVTSEKAWTCGRCPIYYPI
ncbi:hypothetical protein D3C75_450280 [compost metagenome]